VYLEKMPVNDLEAFLEPVFVYFKQNRQPGEGLGDFCDRVGMEAIRQFASTYELGTVTPAEQHDASASEVEVTVTRPAGKVRHRITVRPDLYARLVETAAQQGKPVSLVAGEAIEAYLNGLG
jgi:sulfite reductase (ferredoxin)